MAVWRARKGNGIVRLLVGECFPDEEKAKLAARLMRYMQRTGMMHLTQLMLSK